jgi:hypothetical protein
MPKQTVWELQVPPELADDPKHQLQLENIKMSSMTREMTQGV